MRRAVLTVGTAQSTSPRHAQSEDGLFIRSGLSLARAGLATDLCAIVADGVSRQRGLDGSQQTLKAADEMLDDCLQLLQELPQNTDPLTNFSRAMDAWVAEAHAQNLKRGAAAAYAQVIIVQPHPARGETDERHLFVDQAGDVGVAVVRPTGGHAQIDIICQADQAGGGLKSCLGHRRGVGRKSFCRKLKQCDRVFVFSDGVMVVGVEKLGQLIASASTAQRAADAVVNEALRLGAKDDLTAFVAEFGGVRFSIPATLLQGFLRLRKRFWRPRLVPVIDPGATAPVKACDSERDVTTAVATHFGSVFPLKVSTAQILRRRAAHRCVVAADPIAVTVLTALDAFAEAFPTPGWLDACLKVLSKAPLEAHTDSLALALVAILRAEAGSVHQAIDDLKPVIEGRPPGEAVESLVAMIDLQQRAGAYHELPQLLQRLHAHIALRVSDSGIGWELALL